MADVLSRGTLFNEQITNELFNLVAGKSSIAKLSNREAIPFNGKEVFTFDFENEIDVVAENGKKSHGGIKYEPVKMVPIKVEYGARISDEFLYGSEEYQIKVLKDFNEGFARKLAKGLDLMAFHGINPRTGEASSVIGDNSFEGKVTGNVQEVENLEDPIGVLESASGQVLAGDREVTGMAIAPELSTAIGRLNNNGVRLYPEFMFGTTPDNLNGITIDSNSTVANKGNSVAFVGDFANRFKWGYAKDVTTRVIEFGDPDNSGKDLQGYNQVYIRAEAYLGWGIIDPESFAVVKKAQA